MQSKKKQQHSYQEIFKVQAIAFKNRKLIQPLWEFNYLFYHLPV